MLNVGIERTKFPVEIVELRPGDRLARGGVRHPGLSRPNTGRTPSGFALSEHIRLGRFNPDRAREMGVPEGPLWGKIHKGETVTLPDGRRSSRMSSSVSRAPGRTVVFSGDTRPSPRVIEMARGADLLIHEATFTEEERERADETGHRPRGGGRDGADAGVRQLVLTHISARYSREAPELAEEAKAVFPETVIARDGMTVDVPFAEQREGAGTA